MNNFLKGIFSVMVVILALGCSKNSSFGKQNSNTLQNVATTTRQANTAKPKTLLSAKPNFTANVMAPLHVTNTGEFEGWLTTVKSMGVDAVSVDVWWGDVETSDNAFNWSYYDNLFSKIKAHGLKIVPIMSFHQCGGNVGDDYTSKLPSWIWSKGTDMKYKSEQGNYSAEYVALWADNLAQQEYLDFMNSFETHFSGYAQDFLEINISCGPSGELRYPSYNSHDVGTGYPNRGAFQGYSDRARNDFRQWVQAKYATVSAVQAAWNSNPPITSWSMVNVPTKASGNQMDDFWYFSVENTPYGKDLFAWYNNALVEHGKKMMNYAIQAFDASLANVALGYKISGIHWRMADQTHPRSAELNGGVIPKYDTYNDGNGYGYDKIVMFSKNFTRKVILHFTCLEMDDDPSGQSASMAKSLVFWVGNEAGSLGVTIKGENALSGGVTSDHGWDNIVNATANSFYNGFTALRINNVISGTGKTRYEQYIMQFKGSLFPSLYLRGTCNNWSTSAPMTKSGNVWSINNVHFGNTTSERFKFDVLGDWSKNYGGNGLQGAAVQGGGDIAVQAGATYNVTFDETTLQYKATTTSSSGFPSLYLRGTFNNWGSAAMTKSGNVWSINNVHFGNTTSERFKFDVSGDWSKNYGGNGLQGAAVQGGGDIAVQAGATYNVTFDETTLQYKATTTSSSGFPSLYLRGTFNNWGSAAMTKSGNVWSINNVHFGNTTSERFKFDVLGDWSKNYGGNGLQGAAVQGGGDIAVQGGATYNVTFDETTLFYKATP